jgi:ligand-binding SRPBCC domain-containing protein
MQYRHQFTVQAPQRAVADFHRRADSMGAITPPPVIVQVHSAPEVLVEGDKMDFTMWLGPLPIRWEAAIEQTTPVSFVDRMVRGPFKSWKHLHTYIAIDDHATSVIDEVHAELSDQLFWRVVGLGMWINLPILFAFRGWKTRQLLEQGVPERVGATF